MVEAGLVDGKDLIVGKVQFDELIFVNLNFCFSTMK